MEELPQIADRRSADYLSRKVFKVGWAFLRIVTPGVRYRDSDARVTQYLDPTLVGRNQHFFWGMLRGFRASYYSDHSLFRSYISKSSAGWSYIKMAVLILANVRLLAVLRLILRSTRF